MKCIFFLIFLHLVYPIHPLCNASYISRFRLSQTCCLECSSAKSSGKILILKSTFFNSIKVLENCSFKRLIRIVCTYIIQSISEEILDSLWTIDSNVNWYHVLNSLVFSWISNSKFQLVLLPLTIFPHCVIYPLFFPVLYHNPDRWCHMIIL